MDKIFFNSFRIPIFWARYGGYESSDFCPISFPIFSLNSGKSYCYFYNRCIEGETSYEEKYFLGLSTISDNSICIICSLDDNLNSEYSYERAKCHIISCNNDKRTFIVDIGNHTIERPN